MIATLRAEPPDGPASRALWEEYQALLAERLDAPVADPEHIFASPASFSGPGSAWLVAYDDDGPVACGGLRRVDERRARSSACSSRRAHAGAGTRARCSPSSSGSPPPPASGGCG